MTKQHITVSVNGEVKATILDYDIAKAAAIADTKGIAACGAVWEFAVGAYQRWGGSNGVFCAAWRRCGRRSHRRARRRPARAPSRSTATRRA